MTSTLLHVFSSLAVGGQQTRFVTVANRLGPAFRHYLISLDGNTAAVDLLDPSVDFTVQGGGPEATNLVGQMWRIIALSRTIEADALVTYNWAAIEWALTNRLFLRLPHVHLEDGFGPEEADRQIWRRVVLRRLALRRSMLVVPSHKLVNIACATWRLDPDRVRYIPNGIDPARFDGISRTGAPFFERHDGECIIGSFSPLRAEKNIGRLLRAFAEVPTAERSRVRLVICGDGPERKALVEMARTLGIAAQVEFVGHVPKPEAVMGAFDIFALTSDTEQMPYAVIEAMAARLPVLATDVGDIATMVASENRRYVVPRDDLGAFTAALAELSADRRSRRGIGEANRVKAEADYRIPPMVEAFRRVFYAAIAGRWAKVAAGC